MIITYSGMLASMDIFGETLSIMGLGYPVSGDSGSTELLLSSMEYLNAISVSLC